MRKGFHLTAQTVERWLYGDAIDAGSKEFHIDVPAAALKDPR
jgi:hypothetical protein